MTIDTGVFLAACALPAVLAYFAINAQPTAENLPTFEKIFYKYMTFFSLLIPISLGIYDLSQASLLYNSLNAALWGIGIIILMMFIYDIVSLFLIPIGFFKKFKR